MKSILATFVLIGAVFTTSLPAAAGYTPPDGNWVAKAFAIGAP